MPTLGPFWFWAWLLPTTRWKQKSFWNSHKVIDYGDDNYMQNTISDFLFHLNICEIVSRWSAHLGIWVMTQVAFCRDVFLQVVFGAWQDQWRCAVWLKTENHTHLVGGIFFKLMQFSLVVDIICRSIIAFGHIFSLLNVRFEINFI